MIIYGEDEEIIETAYDRLQVKAVDEYMKLYSTNKLLAEEMFFKIHRDYERKI